MNDDVIKTTGLDVAVLDGGKTVVLSFSSDGRAPIKVSVPIGIAAKLGNFVTGLQAPPPEDGSASVN